MSSPASTHLPDLNIARLNTAGAYVSIGNLYPFAIGYELHDGNIPVIRLGGHVIGQETCWECAAREVKEEADIRIEPIPPDRTYWITVAELERAPNRFSCQEAPWDAQASSPPPYLVVYDAGSPPLLSVMYLARSDDVPAPSGEVKGIVLLERKDIHQLCQAWARQAPITLGQYLQNGGKAMLREPFDMDRPLEPFNQLRILWRLLDRY